MFVCYAGTTHSSVEGWHVSHGLDFDGNPYQITLGFGLRRVRVTARLGHHNALCGRMFYQAFV